ncbi:type VII secretion-associated serine protease mycosin [Mycolicibacterium sp. XJ870]
MRAVDTRRCWRRAAALAAALVLATAPVAPAHAVTPPRSDLAAAPPDGPPGPEVPMRQNSGCIVGGVLPNSDLAKSPPPATALQFDQIHKFSTGAGVLVAVIDTGVRPQPRLPAMVAGGDYVDAAGDGFTDCEGHGTIVAGLIGASHSPDDGFVGIAPNSQILAIRQTSQAFAPQSVGLNTNDPNQSRTAGDIRSLARAIVHAANLGAKVINISVVTCLKSDELIDQSSLGGALRYAVDVKDALVVTAAGNVGGLEAGRTDTGCTSNPPMDPANPQDTRNWTAATAVSTPSWFDELVLSVGFVSPDGIRSQHSMAGPWVDVAAPGSGIVSLTNGDAHQVINGMASDKGGLVPIAGTSFAAAFVSGTAALLRSRFPQLSARQVATRIINTAHAPARGIDNVVGRGMIDPLAALTYDVPITGEPEITVSASELAIPAPPPPPDARPKMVAGIVSAAIALLAVCVWIIAITVRASGSRRT